ncbi:heparin lyase I family protein [Ensifer sp. ENS12]|uniref:heparin lyase I family protein n=1 Tax=Ensifer sp. ENS12 TaxID=2854774 RepID=UPI001C495116|nr:heparin lyase I family protein [Ensifer sp. ENS12]MBV7519084.1 heparin lyase I family protein [Ensifer sp. ENS12]
MSVAMLGIGRLGIRLLASVLLVSAPNALASNLDDEFAEGSLVRSHWCTCQMDEGLLSFPKDEDGSGDFIARITVDKTVTGEKKCDLSQCTVFEVEPEPSQGERLGPSFMQEPRMEISAEGGPLKKKNPYCKFDNPSDKRCMQRQEMRLTKTYQYPFEQLVDYTIRFRMPKEVGNETDSLRWVIAQWKQEPAQQVADAGGTQANLTKNASQSDEPEEVWEPSPILAQRYDDGVLHLTVQDGDCRCIVASEKTPANWAHGWENGKSPPDCRYTFPSALEDRQCVSSLILEFNGEPKLTTARGVWTEMKYEVQPGRKGAGGSITVIQDGKFVVKVTGKIGYDDVPDKPPKQKFKIGHYRDIMDTSDTMDIDRVTVVAK